MTISDTDVPATTTPSAAGPIADMLMTRAQVCRKAALLHRERGEYETAAWLEGKAWGFREAAGHLLLRGPAALRSAG